jgi:hypothetical protein
MKSAQLIGGLDQTPSPLERWPPPTYDDQLLQLLLTALRVVGHSAGRPGSHSRV